MKTITCENETGIIYQSEFSDNANTTELEQAWRLSGTVTVSTVKTFPRLMRHGEAVNFLESRRKGGQFFTVEFKKREDGSLRKMQARFGVTKHLKGGPPAYNPYDYDLFWVWDMGKEAYRSIPARPGELKRVKVKGEWVEVAQAA